MDDQTRVYWLMRALHFQPGFSYRPNGLFEFWGVPLHEIPASVFPENWQKIINGDWGFTTSLAWELGSNVLKWLAARHLEAVN